MNAQQGRKIRQVIARAPRDFPRPQNEETELGPMWKRLPVEQLFKGIGGTAIIDESVGVRFVLDTKDASDDGMALAVPRDFGFGH